MIASGAFMAISYSQIYHHEAAITTYSLTIPGGECINEPSTFEQTGYYAFIVDVKNGTINSAVLSEQDFAAFSLGQYEPHWQSCRESQGLGGTMEGGANNHMYLVLSNPDAFDKQVGVEVYQAWDAYNILGLAGGILLLAGGVVACYLANRSHLAEFNKALENQE
jgi:hypothetical protein